MPGIDGQKMSKSYGNTIEIFAEGKALQEDGDGHRHRQQPVADPKDPTKCNVFALYSLFATEEEKAALAERYRAGGMGYGDAKKRCWRRSKRTSGRPGRSARNWPADPDLVEDVLNDGAQTSESGSAKDDGLGARGGWDEAAAHRLIQWAAITPHESPSAALAPDS